MRLLTLFRLCILSDLYQKPFRAALTVSGVALGLAAVVAVHLASDRAIRSFTQSLRLTSGNADLHISSSPLPLDETIMEDLAWIWEFGSMAPVVQGRARLQGGPSVRILGIDLLSDFPFGSYLPRSDPALLSDWTRRDFMDLLLDPNRIILPEDLARQLQVDESSSLPLLIGQQWRPFEVGALLRLEGVAKAFDSQVVFMDIAAAQWHLDKIGRIDRLDISLKENSNRTSVLQRIRRLLPSGVVVRRPDDLVRQREKMLQAFRVNLTALSSIALIVGGILVYNTVTIAVIRRRSEIGTLRALGASRSTVAGLFLLEAFLFGLVGVGGGILLGRYLARAVGSLVEGTVQLFYTGVPLGNDWSVDGIWFYGGVLALGILLAGFSGLFPSLRAAGLAPAEILREGPLSSNRPGRSASLARFGLASLAIGTAGCFLPPWGGIPIFGYVAAVSFILGVGLLIPSLAVFLTRLLNAPLTRLFSVEGQLGVRTVQGNIGRVVGATSCLMIAVALLVGVSTMVGSFRRTVSIWVEQTLRGDLYIKPGGSATGDWSATLQSPTVSWIECLEGVAAVERFRGRTVLLRDVPLTLAGVDFNVLGEYGNLLFVDGRSTRQVAERLIDKDRVIISEPLAIKQGLRPGGELPLPTIGRTFHFEIEAVYYDYSSDQGVVLMDRTTYVRHFRDSSVTDLAVYTEPGIQSEALLTHILDRWPESALNVVPNSQLKTRVLEIFDRTFLITYGLELVAVLVAVLGIANTLTALALERRSELAVFRFLGARRSQIRKLILVESGVVGFLGCTFGVFLGALLSIVLIYVINRQSFGWTIQFSPPWAFLAGGLLLVFLSTLVAGLYPALLAARTNPIQGIRAG